MKNQNVDFFSFFRLSKSTYFLLFITLILHLYLTWQWPMLNDEAYYWDWSRNLQLSYVDAPPAISWIAWIGSHLFPGSFGVRFLIPFLNLASALFLINSAKLLWEYYHNFKIKNINFNNKSLIVAYIFGAIPIFNINGIFLMPDAPLLLGCSGSLYFALKACIKTDSKKGLKLQLTHGILLGIFLGFGIASKYQGVPVAVAIFLAIVIFRGFKNTILKDFKFWALTISFAIVISSPLFIWNFKHNFASFKFQGQHGYGVWNLDISNFFLYLLCVSLILLPWYSYLFVKQIWHSIKNKNFFSSPDIISIFGFLSIFLFIGSSALGGLKTQVHWITPSAIFLIPLIAANWEKLIGHSHALWQKINLISFILTNLVAIFVFTDPIQKIISSPKTIFGFKIQKLHKGIYRNFNWANLKDPIEQIKKNVPNFSEIEKPYFSLNSNCNNQPYLATLNWRWTSQFAFNIKHQPRVFSLDLAHSSYYLWRDNLTDIAGCKVFILAGKNIIAFNSLDKIMTIDKMYEFRIQENFTHDFVNMMFIEGTMKDKKKIESFSEYLTSRAFY